MTVGIRVDILDRGIKKRMQITGKNKCCDQQMKSNQSTLEQVRKIYLTEFYDEKENTEGDIGLAR